MQAAAVRLAVNSAHTHQNPGKCPEISRNNKPVKTRILFPLSLNSKRGSRYGSRAYEKQKTFKSSVKCLRVPIKFPC